MSNIRNDEYLNAGERLNARYRDNGHGVQTNIYVDVLGGALWVGRYCEHRFAGKGHEDAIRAVENEICTVEGKPLPFPPAPPPEPPQHRRIGASYYTSLTDPRCDPTAFAAKLREAGCSFTRVWLMDAWAVGQGTGCYDGFYPWVKQAGGGYDLASASPSYHARLQVYVKAMNNAGITPILTALERYSWDNAKQGLLWVPDANKGPFRNNIQGLSYTGDDHTYFTLAQSGDFLCAFYAQCVRTLSGLTYEVETGNEMPEKGLHERIRDAWRSAGFTGKIACNRQEDTPGQYTNMKVGTAYDGIAYHGKGHLSYLDEVFDREPTHKTFRSFFASGPDFSRITLSSDGCRKSTDVNDAYDYPALAGVAKDILARGGRFEHQSCMKLRGFTHGTIDLNDLEVGWLKTLAY